MKRVTAVAAATLLLLAGGLWLARKATWNIGNDAEEYAYKTASGDGEYFLKHTFPFETGYEKVNAPAFTNYLRSCIGDARVKEVKLVSPANLGEIGICRYYLEVDGQKLPMTSNVYWTPDGPRQTLANAIYDAWHIRAFRSRDPRNLMTVYAEYVARDKSILESMGIKEVYRQDETDRVSTWDEMLVRFQMAIQDRPSQGPSRGDGT